MMGDLRTRNVTPPTDRSPGRLFAWAALAAVAGLCALAIDCPVARWCQTGHLPGDLAKLLSLAEPFGHGLGVLVIAVTIWRLDPARLRAIPRVLTASLGAGLAANVLKMLIARTRPRAFDFTGNVWDTFGDWLPLATGGSAQQGFPSAHAATAVGLAVALAWLYPRGRWLFATLAVLVACQRVHGSAHFPSDTCFGAALGLVVAAAVLYTGPLARRFDRFETKPTGCNPWA